MRKKSHAMLLVIEAIGFTCFLIREADLNVTLFLSKHVIIVTVFKELM